MNSIPVAETADAAPKRMKSEDRRELIVAAAMAVFGANGYSGTTTDEVARAAGVSQPYVVRLFGTKEKLFLAAMQDALDRLMIGFRSALVGDDGIEGRKRRMGEAYMELLAVRGLHMTLSHGFLLGGDPVVGPAARAGFAQVWAFLREEAGFDAAYAHAFLAYGMLLNTMIGLRMTTEYKVDAGMTELLDQCFTDDIDAALRLLPEATDRW